MTSRLTSTRLETERELDLTLAGSFPASDPPPWTFGVPSMTGPAHVGAQAAASSDVIIGEGQSRRGRRMAAIGEVLAMSAIVPLAILIAGLPIALVMWVIRTLLA